ncbi:MAG: hypothetical protein ACRD9W_17725, partial [Terriglobia bacterium]
MDRRHRGLTCCWVKSTLKVVASGADLSDFIGMPITVLCPSCHSRFAVHEKFAGKQGPCPKCKATITVPAAGEEVQIHAPEEYGGVKDAKGQSVLKPLERVEAKVQPVIVVGVGMSVVLAFVVAFVLRTSDLRSSPVILALGAIVLAPPLVVAAYTFLRNQELEPYRGVALGARVAICAIVYAALW